MRSGKPSEKRRWEIGQNPNSRTRARLESLKADGSRGSVSSVPVLGTQLAYDVPAHGGDVRERRLAEFRQNVARFRLYRLRFLQENMRFAAFLKIYQIINLNFFNFGNILRILRHLQNFC